MAFGVEREYFLDPDIWRANVALIHVSLSGENKHDGLVVI